MDLETAYQMAFLATINDTEFWDKQKQITPWVLGEARERLKQSLLAAQRSWLQARRINPDTFKERSYYEFKFSKSSSDETFLWKCSGAVQLWGHSPQVFNSSSAGYPVKGRLSGLVSINLFPRDGPRHQCEEWSVDYITATPHPDFPPEEITPYME
ncbi:hypothetical protein M231_07269 [Tremella mesenterica]|uniref:Uncharacterized protein n=1 Tax=Tremella mesenterica TaxID=5217 RepID=A0A4Q1BBK9_TREME|nr:hypothetical protein M231_07269 [Tremella mesenterica]